MHISKAICMGILDLIKCLRQLFMNLIRGGYEVGTLVYGLVLDVFTCELYMMDMLDFTGMFLRQQRDK